MTEYTVTISPLLIPYYIETEFNMLLSYPVIQELIPYSKVTIVQGLTY